MERAPTTAPATPVRRSCGRDPSFEGAGRPGRPGGPGRPVDGSPPPRRAAADAWHPRRAAHPRADRRANFWTDLLWYQSVGYRKVFTTELLAKVLLFVVGGLHRRRRRLLQPDHRLPHPAGLRAGLAGAGQPGPLPRADRAAAPDRHDRRTGRGRPALRRRGGRAVAHLPAVAAPRAVRHQGPAVPSRRRASSSSPCRGCGSCSAS